MPITIDTSQRNCQDCRSLWPVSGMERNENTLNGARGTSDRVMGS